MTKLPAREVTPFGQFQLRRSHLKTQIPGADKFRGDWISTTPDWTPEVASAALHQIVMHSRTIPEARDLIAMLGLTKYLEERA